MIRNAPPKHPDSSKWYWLDWPAKELQSASITTSTWLLPVGITNDAESLSGKRVGIRLGGGTDGQDYNVINEIVTSSGEVLHETLVIRCRTSGH